MAILSNIITPTNVLTSSSTSVLTNKSFGDNPIFSAGVAGGVAYLNGSKVLTTGSALTFDGTTFKASKAGSLGILAENTANTSAAYVQVTNTAGSTYLGQDSVGGYVGTGYSAPFLFYINNAEQMRLTSTGLGIGTSSPSGRLHAYFTEPTSTNRNGFYMSTSATNSEASLVRTGPSHNYAGVGGSQWWLYHYSSLAIGSDSASAVISFVTNATERARITSGGNLLVGTTASQGKLTVQTDITAINSGAWYTAGSNGGVLNLGNEIGNPARVRAVTPASRGSASELALAFDVVSSGGSTFEAARINSNGEFYIAGTTDQGAYNLQVNGTGVWGAGAYVNGSDVRLKENVQTLTDGLSVVTKLRPVTFQYKAEYSKDTAVQPGFIAQELQQAMAGKDYVDGVVQSGPEYLNVAYQSLIPVLVKAIQELKAELDSVKTELATLKGN